MKRRKLKLDGCCGAFREQLEEDLVEERGIEFRERGE